MHRLQDKAATETKETSATQSEEVSSDEGYEILTADQLQLQEESGKITQAQQKMSGPLKVKAALQDGAGGSSPEIRRFTVRGEEGGSGDLYASLLTTVHSVFGINTQHQRCSLSWKDEDDDLVQFSTTEELRHAMDSMYDDTIRLYVTVTSDVVQEAAAPSMDQEGTDADRGVRFQTPLQSSAPPPSPPRGPPFPCQWLGPGRQVLFPDRRQCGKKGWKMMKMMQKYGMTAAGNDEFNAVRQQVPEEFRAWVRQYVRQWYAKGGEAACQVDSLPVGAPLDFPRWLNRFLQRYTARHAGKAADGAAEMAEEEGEEEEEEGEEEMLAAPEGLSPVYYRWLCLFVRRFCLRQANGTAGSEGGQGPQCPRMQWGFQGHGFHHGRGRHGCHGRRRWHGKYGCHGNQGWNGKKGGKYGGQSSSSESEDSDSGEKFQAWQKVPKEFRKFVRKSTKKLHKKKGDNSKAREKAIQAGLSPEVLEFVQQFLLEWHAKLSHKRPWAVAKEMMEEKEEERTLPSGMEREHFLWLCRFMARWHLRHAGKCDFMTGWSSGETSDDTSGEEAGPSYEEGCGPCPRDDLRHFRAAMRATYGPPHGMMGHPHQPFAMHHGMDHPCPPHPCHAMTGWAPPPPPSPPFARRGGGCGMGGCGWMTLPGRMMGWGGKRGGGQQARGQDCKRRKDQDGAASGQASSSHDDMVERVTEGVRKL